MKKMPTFLRTLLYLALIVVAVIGYTLAIKVTNPDLEKLVTKIPMAKNVLGGIFTPDLFAKSTAEEIVLNLAVPSPCGSAEAGVPLDTGPRIVISPVCGNTGDTVTIEGYDLGANSAVTLQWVLANGLAMSVKSFDTDQDGYFKLETAIRPITQTEDGVSPQIRVDVSMLSTKLAPTQTLKDVVDAIIVTVFMALLATTFATILAVPLSFLASANIVKKGCFGTVVYYAARTFLSIIRSFEALVLVSIFALIVGYGSPFGGVIALVIITTVSLGKMFSEAVESIDPGPIEAISATGANRVQVIWYAVVPQIVPDFLSYIIYHWDINVRISTIIGFVGGGGIGYYLSQRINTFEYHKVGTALLAIILVVMALDFLSAEMRKRFI